MFPITIISIGGPLTLSEKAAAYVAHKLRTSDVEQCRATFSALGMDDDADNWAKHAVAAQHLERQLRSARRKADVARISTDLAAETAHASLAWSGLQQVIDRCREAGPASR